MKMQPTHGGVSSWLDNGPSSPVKVSKKRWSFFPSPGAQSLSLSLLQSLKYILFVTTASWGSGMSLSLRPPAFRHVCYTLTGWFRTCEINEKKMTV